MTTMMCDFVTLRTNRECKNGAVWIDRPNNSTKVCGIHKAELLRIAKRGESKGFVRISQEKR